MRDEAAATQPWHDPIVEEVRAAREDLLASCAFDLDKLATLLRQKQRAEGREVVTLSPRRPGEWRHIETPS